MIFGEKWDLKARKAEIINQVWKCDTSSTSNLNCKWMELSLWEQQEVMTNIKLLFSQIGQWLHFFNNILVWLSQVNPKKSTTMCNYVLQPHSTSNHRYARGTTTKRNQLTFTDGTIILGLQTNCPDVVYKHKEMVRVTCATWIQLNFN